LAVAVEKAEAVLAGLTGKLERSVARREPKRTGGLPPGARRVEIDGVPMVLSEDGRLLARSVKDGRWMLFADERDFDAGAMLRWLDPDDQLPRFADPPPHVFRDGESRVPDRDEVVEWARLRGVPEAAALAWLDQERRWSRFVLRDDVDVARFGPRSDSAIAISVYRRPCFLITIPLYCGAWLPTTSVSTGRTGIARWKSGWWRWRRGSRPR
jgi:hypothetical protein